MSKVYIVQRPVRRDPNSRKLVELYDVSSAAEYGELVTLLSPRAQPFSPGLIIPELRQKLSKYTFKDWLLCLGSPVLIGWATAIAADTANGRVNMLQWHGKEKRYIPVEALLWQ